MGRNDDRLMDEMEGLAHGLAGVFGLVGRMMLAVFGFIDGGARSLMRGAGLPGDVQSVVLIFLILTFLAAALRLLRGRLRTVVACAFGLVLAHALEEVARGGVG